MIVYTILKFLTTFWLNIFYEDIEVIGADKIPKTGPVGAFANYDLLFSQVLFVATHPNALIGALMIKPANFFLLRRPGPRCY
jgi:hypothetical protein